MYIINIMMCFIKDLCFNYNDINKVMKGVLLNKQLSNYMVTDN